MSERPHPKYGPCDGFGPNGTCSECTGIVESKPSDSPAYRAGLAEGFRRGVEAAAKWCEKDMNTACAEFCAVAIRALRPEGEKT